MTLGERLKKIRGAITQEEFAKSVDISALQISRIENDKSGMSLDLAVKIARKYGCSVDWLSMGEETLKPSPQVSEPEIEYVPLSKHMEVLEKYNKLLEERVEKQDERIRERSLHT